MMESGLSGSAGRTFELHSFFRSSTSYRVRVALNLKGLPYRQVTHNFRKNEQRAAGYLKLNPQGLVPTLCSSDGLSLPQSLAIIEWLDEAYPEPALLPSDIDGRGRVRALAQIVALDIHPINNLRILSVLRDEFGADDEAVSRWFSRWVNLGLDAFEQQLVGSSETGEFCHGDHVTLADICLVSQLTNNRRFGIDPAKWPTIKRISETCLEMDAFRTALPEHQPDAVP